MCRSSVVDAVITFKIVTLHYMSSSSLGAITSVFECFVLLNIFPVFTILDAVSPILYFQFLHIIPCQLPICSLVSLVVFLTSVPTYILLSPFSLLAFNVNGQTNLILVLLSNLLCSYVSTICTSLFKFLRNGLIMAIKAETSSH
jgi:hypothetical protein